MVNEEFFPEGFWRQSLSESDVDGHPLLVRGAPGSHFISEISEIQQFWWCRVSVEDQHGDFFKPNGISPGRNPAR